MKVLQINKLYYPWIGGVETVVKQIAEGLAKRGVEVTVLSVNERKTKEKIVTSHLNGVKIIKTRQTFFFGSLPFSWQFFREIKQHPADIYHFHFPDPLAIICALLAGLKGKIIVTYHSDIVRQRIRGFIFMPLVLLFLRRADQIIATSPKLMASSRVLRLFRRKVRIIPLGIDPALYHTEPAVLKQTENKYGRDFILGVGRLVGYKGFEYLINAMEFIPDKKLIIVGSGLLEDKLKKLINKKGLTDRVLLVKSLSGKQLQAMYALAQIFVLSSISNNEAFGIVQLEAMYYGRPVVTTDLNTGVTYVNQHKKTGMVVKRKSAEALAAGINELLTNKRLFRQITKNNRNYILKNFTTDIMLKNYLACYKKVTGQNPAVII